MAEVDLSSGWALRCDSAESAARLAQRELEELLPRITGHEGKGESPWRFGLSHGDGGREEERFLWRAGDRRLDLYGDSPRGLLCGTYALLEELGCRWSWPGESGEGLGRGLRFQVREKVEHAPVLPGRCLVLGERSLVERADDWVVWAARNRLNALFVHVSLSERPFGSAPESAWRSVRDRVTPLLRERGMILEHGGHLLPDLLADEELRDLGAGGSDGRAGRGPARDAIASYVEDHPEVDVFHLWGTDVEAPGGTGEETQSERALRVANVLGATVAEHRSEASVSHLAYHATLPVPTRARPGPNVCLAWAPRERCYDHGAGDAGCEENSRHARLFRAQVEHFRSAGAGPPRVFEYYLDPIRFGCEPPALGRVMAADLDFYREAGAHTVQALMTGRRDWSRPHPNAELFARLAWDPSRVREPAGR